MSEANSGEINNLIPEQGHLPPAEDEQQNEEINQASIVENDREDERDQVEDDNEESLYESNENYYEGIAAGIMADDEERRVNDSEIQAQVASDIHGHDDSSNQFGSNEHDDINEHGDINDANDDVNDSLLMSALNHINDEILKSQRELHQEADIDQQRYDEQPQLNIGTDENHNMEIQGTQGHQELTKEQPLAEHIVEQRVIEEVATHGQLTEERISQASVPEKQVEQEQLFPDVIFEKQVFVGQVPKEHEQVKQEEEEEEARVQQIQEVVQREHEKSQHEPLQEEPVHEDQVSEQVSRQPLQEQRPQEQTTESQAQNEEREGNLLEDQLKKREIPEGQTSQSQEQAQAKQKELVGDSISKETGQVTSSGFQQSERGSVQVEPQQEDTHSDAAVEESQRDLDVGKEGQEASQPQAQSNQYKSQEAADKSPVPAQKETETPVATTVSTEQGKERVAENNNDDVVMQDVTTTEGALPDEEAQRTQNGEPVEKAALPAAEPSATLGIDKGNESDGSIQEVYPGSSTRYFSDLLPANDYVRKQSETGSSILDKIKQMSTLPYVSTSQAQRAALPLIVTAPEYLPLEMQLSINSLPILDNLATQLLRIFVCASYEQILALTQPATPEDPEDPDLVPELSADAESFQALVRLFSIAKSVYTRNEKDFISVEDVAPGIWKPGEPVPVVLMGKEEIFENSLKKANLATFICGVINSIEMEFISLNESFLEVFCPTDNSIYPSNSAMEGSDEPPPNNTPESIIASVTGYGMSGRLLKAHAALFLELKTQAYISALISHNSKEIAANDLEHLFPPDLDKLLLHRRNARTLTPIEAGFVNRCQSRKKMLENSDSVEELVEKYNFDLFVKDLLEYMNNNLGLLVYGRRFRALGPKRTLWATINGNSSTNSYSEPNGSGNNAPDLNAKPLFGESSLAQLKTSTGITGLSALDSLNRYNKRLHSAIDGDSNENESTAVSQSVTPPVAYSATPAPGRKAPKKPRKVVKSNKPSVRRVWTKEEEEALREGLRLRGAHWAQILELFGAGGEISEALKDRTQLQLKDKARNWKMYYLREELEIPDYLKGVTGELGTSDKHGNGRTLGKKRIKQKMLEQSQRRLTSANADAGASSQNEGPGGSSSSMSNISPELTNNGDDVASNQPAANGADGPELGTTESGAASASAAESRS